MGAWLAQTVAVLILLFRAGHSYGSYLPVALAGMYMAIVLHALCGYVLGRYLPKILAVACAVIGSYGWVAFAWTVEPLQIRYMAGPALAFCCTSAGELAPQAPWVLLLFSSFLSGAVFLALVGLMNERSSKLRVSLWGAGAYMAILGVS